MVDYRELYFMLFRGTERALRELEKQNYGLAAEILISAQQQAEEAVLAAED